MIDTLAPGIDLKPFFELMGNEAVLKVFHAARQDIEIVWHLSNTIPHPIFDTQVAAMVLGYGDSIAYDQLVERVTELLELARGAQGIFGGDLVAVQRDLELPAALPGPATARVVDHQSAHGA